MTTSAVVIKNAYYLAQVLDPREEIEGFEAGEGLRILNLILANWGSLKIYIPTYTQLTQVVTSGDFSYDITPAITSATRGHLVDQNNVQYPVEVIDLARYNTLNFALTNQNSRPNQVFIKNDFANWPTLSQLIFYPIPDNTYTVTLWVWKRLANVTYSQDLTQVPDYWINALTYELAHRLASINATVLPQSFLDDYDMIIKQVKAANKRDKRVIVNNQFQTTRKYKPWGTYVD